MEKNYATALKWFEKSAAQGIGQAQFNLGVFYENGYGVDQDVQTASSWYEKAAAQGVREAEKKLAQINSADYSAPEIAANTEVDTDTLFTDGEAPEFDEATVEAEPMDSPLPVDEAAEPGSPEMETEGVKGREWVLQQNPAYYTLQIGSGTREQDIVNFLKENGIENEAAYIEVEIKGVTRYNALYGVYENFSLANEAVEALPAKLRKVKPWVRSFRMVHKLLGREDDS